MVVWERKALLSPVARPPAQPSTLVMASRAVAGTRGRTIIINLSGRPKAVREQLEFLAPVLGHIIKDCRGVPVATRRR